MEESRYARHRILCQASESQKALEGGPCFPFPGGKGDQCLAGASPSRGDCLSGMSSAFADLRSCDDAALAAPGSRRMSDLVARTYPARFLPGTWRSANAGSFVAGG